MAASLQKKCVLLFIGLVTLADNASAIVPGCESYRVNAGDIYVDKHPERSVVGRAYQFESQSDPLLAWGHKTTWKLLYFTPPSTSTVTQTKQDSIDAEGESDVYLTPTHRETNYVAVIDKNDEVCDNATFLAINAPTVSINVANKSTDGTYAYGDFFMSGTMDEQYAINAVAGLPMKFQAQRKSIGQWTGSRCEVVEETSTWKNVISLSYQTSYNYVERCDTQYRFRIYDGEFFSTWTSQIVIGGSTGSGSGSSSGGSSGGSSCPRPPCDFEP